MSLGTCVTLRQARLVLISTHLPILEGQKAELA